MNEDETNDEMDADTDNTKKSLRSRPDSSAAGKNLDLASLDTTTADFSCLLGQDVGGRKFNVQIY